jgi:hypothetical protein
MISPRPCIKGSRSPVGTLTVNFPAITPGAPSSPTANWGDHMSGTAPASADCRHRSAGSERAWPTASRSPTTRAVHRARCDPEARPHTDDRHAVGGGWSRCQKNGCSGYAARRPRHRAVPSAVVQRARTRYKVRSRTGGRPCRVHASRYSRYTAAARLACGVASWSCSEVSSTCMEGAGARGGRVPREAT